MSKNPRGRTLALAGIFQAVHLVHQVATRGMADSAALEVSVRSVLNTQPADVDEVYGGPTGVAAGLRILRGQMTGNTDAQRDTQLTRYAITVLHLERKLVRRKALLQKIRQGIETASSQAEYFSPTHENVLASLAEVYTNTVSTLHPRVMVNGESGYLNNPSNANKIRALLLAAIRSAFLWRQCGGNRLQLIFGRRRLLNDVERLMADAPQPG